MHTHYLEMQPAEMRIEQVSVPVPETQRPTAYRFAWELTGKEGLWYRWHRDWTVHPRLPLRAPKDLTVALYDPHGATQAALAEAGLRPRPIAALTKRELGPIQLLLIGRNAVDKRFPKSASSQLAAFVRRGGRVFAFSQTDPPKDWLPVALEPGHDEYLTRLFRRVPDHFLVAQLGTDDLIYWRGDHVVSVRPFAKPSRGRFRPIIDGGLALAETPLIELPLGDGFYWLSQLKLVEKLAGEPAARTILQSLLDGANRPADRPRPLLAIGESPAMDYLKQLGFPIKAVGGPPPGEAAVILVEADRLRPQQQTAIDKWVRAGGTLWLRNLTPDDRGRLAKQWPWLAQLDAKPVDHLVKIKAHRLLAGVSNAELYWAKPIYEGKKELAKIVHFVVKAENDNTVKTPWLALTRPAGLTVRDLGSGRVVLDQVQWARARQKVGQRSARLAVLLAQAIATSKR